MFNAAFNVHYRKEKPPCYQNSEDCKERRAGCHAECEEFKAYRQRLEAEKKKQERPSTQNPLLTNSGSKPHAKT